MRQWIFGLLILLAGAVMAAIVTKPETFSAGEVVSSGRVNSNFDTIYNDYNSNITNANISASAAISAAKLNLETITEEVTIRTTAGPVFRLDNQTSTFPIFSALDDGTTIFIVADQGNVAIGTGTPLSLFHVVTGTVTLGNSNGVKTILFRSLDADRGYIQGDNPL